MKKIIIFVPLVVLSTFFISGCFVSQDKYNEKVLAARNLNRRLKKSKGENASFKTNIAKYKNENSLLKKKLISFEGKVQELNDDLDTKSIEQETLESNLNLERESRLKENSEAQRVQGDETKRMKNELGRLKELNYKLSSLKKDNSDRIQHLSFENQNLQTIKLAQAKEITDLMGRMTMLEKDLKKKINRLENMESIKGKLDNILAKDIKAGNVGVLVTDERIRIRVLTDALFDSKDFAKLTRSGRAIIAEISKVLMSKNGRKVIVEGHTDSRGMGPKLKKRFPSNWDLSSERAVTVVRYMAEGMRMNPKLLSSVGKSSFAPVTANTSDEGMKKNRRIDIYVSAK